MANDLSQVKCSHCGAVGINETLDAYFCSECGWWGTSPDKLIYDYDSYQDNPGSDGQVPQKKHI